MDPITTAILAAVAAGVTKVGESAVVDAYQALKAAIKKKFGAESDVAASVESLEKKPESQGRKETVQEEVAAAKADQDPEILAAAKALLEKIQAQPGGEQHIQSIIGDYNAQADRGGTASVNVNFPKDEK